MLSTTTSDEVQNLMALLLVYRDEPHGDHMEETTFQDNDWARRWEQNLYFFLVEILPVAENAQIVDDSPSDIEAAASGEDTRIMHEPAQANNTAPPRECLEAQARVLQRQEDLTMQEAMNRPTKSQRRLELRIQVTSGTSSSSSSSACLHVPVQQDEAMTLNVQMSLSTTTILTKEEDEQEGSSLMQRGPPTNRPLLQGLQAPMAKKVNQLVRRYIMDRLQRLLRECHMLMREQNDLLEIYAHADTSTESGVADDQEEAAGTIADAYIGRLHTQMNVLFDIPMDVDPYEVIVQLAQGLDHEECGRSHRIVRDRGAPRTTMRGRAEDVKKVANRILDETQALIF